ncbi:MAG: B12-binding domain-containing radical SAM protein [Nitrospirae bacterium]|nr:B12-binding domain-containing radical SAM protein [Nitrospirota bacterium]
MKLLLIAPAGLEVQGVKGKHVHHLNLAVIAALATPYFDDIRIIEEEFEALDLEEKADFVGITMMSCQAPRGYWLADHYRRKGVRTICGGSHASFMTEECGRHFDSVVVNEVEMIWSEIMEDLKADKLKPVYQTEQLIDLKDLPMPRKDLFYDAKTTFGAQVLQAGRGCPLGCNFCTVTLMYGKTFRTRPVEHVVEEIRRFPARNFFFVDDNIFFSKKYAYELCEALIPLGIKWGSQGSLELICRDEKLLHLAAKSGCIGLFVGIESIDQETLNSSHKAFNKVKNYEENIRKMHRAGITVIGAFIFGFERDTPSTFDDVLDFAMRNKLAMVNTGILTPFPGTEVYEKTKREATVFDHNWRNYSGARLVWRHPRMSKEEMEENYIRFRKRFYSWASIFKRFWANRAHPLYYLGMNYTHWWRAQRSNEGRALPTAA